MIQNTDSMPQRTLWKETRHCKTSLHNNINELMGTEYYGSKSNQWLVFPQIIQEFIRPTTEVGIFSQFQHIICHLGFRRKTYAIKSLKVLDSWGESATDETPKPRNFRHLNLYLNLGAISSVSLQVHASEDDKQIDLEKERVSKPSIGVYPSSIIFTNNFI